MGLSRSSRSWAYTRHRVGSITLDIVLLAASGHVIVVEVKRNANPELRDRAVIAQIIDYASSFASLTDEELVTLFGSATQTPQTWGEVVQQHFPDEDSCDELAEYLLKGCETAS